MSIRPRRCPRCNGKKIRKRETLGSTTKLLVSQTGDLLMGIGTGGLWWLFGNKSRKTRTYIYTCKNKKCGFEWEADIS